MAPDMYNGPSQAYCTEPNEPDDNAESYQSALFAKILKATNFYFY